MRQRDGVDAIRGDLWKQLGVKLLKLEVRRRERRDWLERASRDDH